MNGSRFGTPTIAVAVVVLMTAVSAVASSGVTYKVVAGKTSSGTVGFSGKTGAGTQATPALTFTDTRTSTAIGCASGMMHGAVTLGRTRTARLGTITTSSASHCTAFGGFARLAYKHKGTWRLNGTGKTANGTTPLSINGVTIVVSSTTCNLTVTGVADGTYLNSTKRLTVKPRTGSGHALKASHVTGCGGAIKIRDTITFAGAYSLSTPKGALHIS